MKIVKKYGLRVVGQEDALSFYVYGIEDKEYSVHLGQSGEEVWTTTSKELAVNIQHNPGHRLYSDFGNPYHPYKPEELEVVEFTITTKKA